MKKYFTLVAAIALAGGFSASASYVTQGDKSLYTFESLSQIEGSGVTKVGDAYHVTDDIEIAATDTLRISDNATVPPTELPFRASATPMSQRESTCSARMPWHCLITSQCNTAAFAAMAT